MPWSSRPVPRSKLNSTPERDSHSRFGRSREPPSTSRSWWKQQVTGQPRTGEKADSSQSTVAPASGSVASSCTVTSAGPITLVMVPRALRMRSRWPRWPGTKTGALAVTLTRPLVPAGVSVNSGGEKRCMGMESHGQLLTCQAVWLVRVMRCGTMSGCTSSSVSALCVKARPGSIAAVHGPAPCATCASPRKTRNSPAASTTR